MLRHLILAVALLTNTSFSQHVGDGSSAVVGPSTQLINTSGVDLDYKLILHNPVQDKNFYLLSLFQSRPEIRKLLKENQALKRLSNDKFQNLRLAARCNDVACYDRLLRLSGPEINTVANEFEVLALHRHFKLLATEMRRSGVFIRYNRLSDPEMLIAAWRDAANGMNRLLNVYGLGKNPFYKDIDRVSFDVSSEAYRKLLKLKLAEIKLAKDSLFFEPTLNFALKLLEANRRDEAGRYEPLEAGENKTSVQNLRNVRWADYPYSFILVLGSGPADSARLSPIGARRAEQGARLFLDHQAPLIIFSGGHVHPMQTPYNEAVEMKKYVMDKFKIPEASILVEPFARHTTTNFRNAARLAFRYGIPTNLKALVTSSEDHIAITAKDGFRIRCSTELGYFPMEFINRISPIAAEFKPSIASLFFDANDPLDP